MPWEWLLLGLFVLLGGGLLLSWRPLRAWAREAEARIAVSMFQQQREHLEAQFLSAASATGKPRGLRWKACDWDNDVVYARERNGGRLIAFVGVTIQFEAIPGSDMEGLPAVGNLRNASAMFFFDRGRWHTVGRTVFNLNPDEAVTHLQGQYERVEPT